MKPTELTGSVLLTFECIFILQELDELVRQKSEQAILILDKIYSTRPNGIEWRDIFPFMRLTTTINLLLIPIAFTAKLTEKQIQELGFSFKDEYGAIFKERNQKVIPTGSKFLQILRNAIVHYPDQLSQNSDPNITFPEGFVMSCRSVIDESEILFCTEEGFIRLVSDVKTLCKSAIRDILKGTAL